MFKVIRFNKGATLADVVMAMVIIIILSGTIITSFSKIYYEMTMVRMNAVAVNIAVNALEKIDELPYKDVTNSLNIEDYIDINEEFEVTLNVKKYNENDVTKQDIIKIVNLTVKYMGKDLEEELNISKLKIREI